MSISTRSYWKEGLAFEGSSGFNSVRMDARGPIGQASGPTPKELVLMGTAGCTGIDVIVHLNKHKQSFTSMEIEANAETSTQGYPAIFTSVSLRFVVTGTVEEQKLVEAVVLSQTKYCGVSAMLSAVAPLSYVVVLNGKEVARGFANFEGISKQN
jgi:putative redox protein